jgi:hypothetical protein
MNPKDTFAVGVRLIGLVSLLYLLGSSVMFFGAGVPWQLVVKLIVWAIISIWLLRGAPQLVRFAYPEN